MSNNIRVIDDFLPTEQFESLQSYVLSMQFPWFYCEHVSLPPEDGAGIVDKNAVETDGFNHIFYDKPWDVKSFTYKQLESFISQLEISLGLREEDIIRFRASMKSPKLGFSEGNYNLPHVDYFFPHESLIYYINDSDGPTYVFDQVHQYTGKNLGIGFDSFTIKTKILPKANRLLWINGLQYHTASNPIQSKRRVIFNININKK